MKTFAWVAVLLAFPFAAVADPIPSHSDLPSYSQVARDLQPTPWIAQSSPPQEPLTAEEAPVLTPQVRTRQPAPPSTPVYSIPQEQIQQKGAQSLADTLKGLPGFAINDVGPGADIHTGTYYRGQTINQSAVLLNGRPFGSNINTYHGGTDFNSIPVEAIDKVELSSGSSTTLYGSEAVGGVINVVTKKGRGPAKLNGAVEYGSLGQSNYRASYGGSTDRVQYNLSYQSFGINNRYPVPVGAANRDPETGLFFNADTYISSYLGSFTFELDERNTLSLDATKFLSRRGLIYFGFPLQRDRLDHDGLNFGLSWKTLLGNAEDS
ncbi:MAG: TonB-dependent receptor plug domain-containing protein, partial [Gemmatimonadaceae bacterium]|nr:TonB-dependent receptor plug domain-containing protein [Gloeobacterales cyanobacterium ES-bin-141]